MGSPYMDTLCERPVSASLRSVSEVWLGEPVEEAREALQFMRRWAMRHLTASQRLFPLRSALGFFNDVGIL